MFVKISLILLLLNFLQADQNFVLECSTLSENGNSEWTSAGKVVAKNLHSNKKKEISLKLNFNSDKIIPCSTDSALIKPVTFCVKPKKLNKYNKKEICENDCTYLLRIVSLENGNSFMSSISSKFLKNKKYNEKIEVFLNFDDEIIGFSYMISNFLEKHQINELPSIILSESFEAPQMHFHSEEEIIREKVGGVVVEDPQEQSFFKKYFWYIVIGGLLFFMLSSVDKEKLNDTVKKAQEQAGRQ